MLKSLRKKGVAKKILVVLAVVIVPAFVLWGSATLLRTQKYSYAGRIFGRNVSFLEYQKALRAVQNQAIMQFGEEYEKLQRFLNLETEAWERLILIQEARKRGIRVANNEVVETISKMPFFQKDDKFDDRTYKNVVEYIFRTPPRLFEEQIRDQIMLNRLFRRITDKVSVSEEELLAAYKRENEKVKVSYILIPPTDFEKGVSVTEDEVKEYYNGHRQEFKQPPSINIQYLGASYPKEATAEDKKQLQERLQAVYSQLQKKESPDKLAKENNLEIKETGFFSAENEIPSGVPFEVIQTAFTLKDNQFSPPFLAASGGFIARVKERRDTYIPDFPEAKPKVEKTLIQKKALAMAKEKADQIFKKIDLKAKDFKGWATQSGMTLNQTDFFKLGEYLSQIGPSAEFQNAAFSLEEKDQVSEPVATPQGFYILKLDEVMKMDEDKFKKEKEAFQAKLLEQQKTRFFSHFFADLREKANLKDNISAMKSKGEF
jgi:peptidyl-prolyl cis-trans isomerase D